MESEKLLGDKKIFVVYVNIGNLDSNDVESYIDKIKNNLGFSEYSDVKTLFIPITHGDSRIERI